MARDYDSTVARIAGNVLSGALSAPDLQRIGYDTEFREGFQMIVRGAVKVARHVVAETKRAAELEAEALLLPPDRERGPRP